MSRRGQNGIAIGTAANFMGYVSGAAQHAQARRMVSSGYMSQSEARRMVGIPMPQPQGSDASNEQAPGQRVPARSRFA